MPSAVAPGTVVQNSPWIRSAAAWRWAGTRHRSVTWMVAMVRPMLPNRARKVHLQARNRAAVGGFDSMHAMQPAASANLPRLSMVQVLVCGACIVTLSMGIRHGFGLWLQPVTMDRG